MFSRLLIQFAAGITRRAGQEVEFGIVRRTFESMTSRFFRLAIRLRLEEQRGQIPPRNRLLWIKLDRPLKLVFRFLDLAGTERRSAQFQMGVGVAGVGHQGLQ